MTRVVLAAAHLDNDPANSRLSNLRGLCRRCHMLHDRPFHLAQRWLTYRRRWAIGDLFFGRYGIRPPSATLFAMVSQTGISRDRGHLGLNTLRTGGRVFADWPQAGGRTVTSGSVGDLFQPAR
jgi:hypothetical protein